MGDEIGPAARLLQRYLKNKEALDAIAEENAGIVKALQALDTEIPTIEQDGLRIRATVVSRESTRVNLMRLKSIDFSLYKSVTKPALDTVALHETLEAGMWTEEAKACINTTQSAPYLRFTRYPIEEKESTDE